MSGLIVVNNSDNIDIEGYINIVNELFGSSQATSATGIFDEISEYSSVEIIDTLKAAAAKDPAGGASPRLVKIKHKKKSILPLVEIDSRKVALRVTFDDRKNPEGKRKYVINLPRENPIESSAIPLDYLGDYITALNSIGNAHNESAQVRKQKFLFGVMLLTRCM